jgi:hypothetical protein
MARLTAKYGIRQFAMNLIDASSFGRMLAKIAHSLAEAEIGSAKFVPFLRDIILNERGDDLLRFVGSMGGETEPSGGTVTHTWRLQPERSEGRTYLSAHIQLFSNLGAPAYRVIVGQMNKDFNPLIPLPPLPHYRWWRLRHLLP